MLCLIPFYISTWGSSIPAFPPKKVTNHNNNDNNWITLGIKTSCRHKRELYLISRNSNDEKLKRHYQAYCKILLKVIKEAKNYIMTQKLKKSNNKCKATWEIIKKLTNNHYSHIDIQELMVDNKHWKDQYNIADAFNDFFSSIVDNINKNEVNNKNNNAKVFTTHYYLEQNYAHSSPSLIIKTFSTKTITSTIKALKTKNSHVFDEISVRLLKVSATYICPPLTHICSKSILSRNLSWPYEVFNCKTNIQERKQNEPN